MSPSSFLNYGAIGLGFGLAYLTYWLLRAEQRMKPPRRRVLTAVYAFMLFSLILVGLGFYKEFKRPEMEASQEVAACNAQKQQAIDQLLHTHETISRMLTKKESKLHQLEAQTGFSETSEALADELGDLDNLIRDELKSAGVTQSPSK